VTKNYLQVNKYVPAKRVLMDDAILPIDYRTVNSNEIIFELDAKSYKQNYKYAILILDVLKKRNIPFYICHSGGKGIHIHTFFEPLMDEEVEELLDNALKLNLQWNNIRLWLWNKILDETEIPKNLRGTGKEIDSATITFSDFCQGKVIRCIGGRKINYDKKLQKIDDTYYKSCIPLNEFNDKKPKVTEYDKVQYPKSIDFYNIPLEDFKIFLKSYIEQNKDNEDYKHVDMSGESYHKLPCINAIMDGLKEGNRAAGAQVIAVSCRCDGVGIDEARNMVKEYVDNCSQLGEPFKINEAEQWLKWIYGQKDYYWNCGLAKNLNVCNRSNCPYHKKKNVEAIEFLRNAALLNKIKEVLDELISGESRNKILLFLLCLTKDFNNTLPSGVLLSSESSAGKSFTTKAILKLFPEEDIYDFSRITGKALDRAEMSFKNKILFIEEYQGSKDTQETLRVLMSEGKLKLLTNEKDDDGNIVTVIKESDGCPMFISTTAESELEDQMNTRIWLISLDESREQTKQVNEFTAELYSIGMLGYGVDELELKIRRIQDALKNLDKFDKDFECLIPYADLVAFPYTNIRSRRDFPKYLNLIKISAYLHQKQRPIVSVDDKRFIIATLQDYEIARELTKDCLLPTLIGVPANFMRIYNVCKECSDGQPFTVKQASDWTVFSEKRIWTVLNYLNRQNLLSMEKIDRKNVYSFKNIDESITPLKPAEVLKDSISVEFMQNFVDKILKTCPRTSRGSEFEGLENEVDDKNEDSQLLSQRVVLRNFTNSVDFKSTEMPFSATSLQKCVLERSSNFMILSTSEKTKVPQDVPREAEGSDSEKKECKSCGGSFSYLYNEELCDLCWNDTKCERCGEFFHKNNYNQKYCDNCNMIIEKEEK